MSSVSQISGSRKYGNAKFYIELKYCASGPTPRDKTREEDQVNKKRFLQIVPANDASLFDVKS